MRDQKPIRTDFWNAVSDYVRRYPRNYKTTRRRIARVNRSYRNYANLDLWIYHFFDHYELRNLMARTNDWEFVNVTMTAQLSKEFEVFSEKIDVPWTDLVADLGENGYKVSISYVAESDAFVVSVSGKKDHPLNAKKTMTTWCGNPEAGLLGAYWKVFGLFKGKEWSTIEHKGDIW